MSDSHTPGRRPRTRKEPAANLPAYQEMRAAASLAAEQIAREEERTETKMNRLREERDRAMARLIGGGASLAAAAEAGGLSPSSKSAAAAAARNYPDEVEAGRRAVEGRGAEE